MKFFRKLNHKNEKNIQTGNFIGSQINLVKMSNGDPSVLNDECCVKNMNEMNGNENEIEMKC